MKQQKSLYPTKEDINQKWYAIDATGQVLGRVASVVASILRGKRNPKFTPSVDMGDFVIIYNSEKIKVTGNKLQDKKYYSHSGYPGGLKVTGLNTVLEKSPEKVLMTAIKGMLPHNRIGKQMLKKVRVYKGEPQAHEAQKPQELKI